MLHPLLRSWRVSDRSRFLGGSAIRWAESLIRESTRSGGELLPLRENRILREFVAGDTAKQLRERHASFSLDHRVRLRLPRDDDDPERQGDLIILKAPTPDTGEKGVLLVKYSESIERFAALFAIEDLARSYALVLEPSSWGYADLRFLLYIGSDARVLVQAPMEADRRFVTESQSNLYPLELGAGDWVNPATFGPSPGLDRKWDVAMVASWSRIKRHDVLFEALRSLRRDGHRLAAVLIGYPMDLDLGSIERLAESYGVREQCTFFEAIPHERVGEVLASSKVSVLLSRQEGANKALYESLFADTPILVPRDHLGVNLDQVREIGALFSESDLKEHLLRFAREGPSMSPRSWALANTGAVRSTETLNDVLRDLAREAEEPWTRDIAAKMNAPGLRYLEPGRYRHFEKAYQDLAAHLR